MPPRRELTVAYALSGLLAMLLLVSSVAGLLFGGRGFYNAYPASLAGLVGQDTVTLVVGVPLLIASMWLAGRGSIGALLVWTGTLFYFSYSYYFYVMGGFNALFLLYIAIVSASLYGLLSLLIAIDREAIRGRFGSGAQRRPIAGFFVGISLLFALMWGGMIVSNAVAGTQPDEVLRSVVIIDCTVLLPLLFFGGLWLWHGEAWGYVLGGLLRTKLAATGFTLAFTTALGALWAGKIGGFDAFLFVVFALMAIGAILLIVPYVGSIGRIGGSAPIEERRGTESLDGQLYTKYLIAWFGIVVLGLVNATVRQVVCGRYVSELVGHQISTLTFAILVGLYTWTMGGFLELSSPGEAIGVGLMWMVLTVVFEFALGRYVVGDPWGKLFHDYNVLDGRVWGLFVLWVGLAPYVFYRLEG